MRASSLGRLALVCGVLAACSGRSSAPPTRAAAPAAVPIATTPKIVDLCHGPEEDSPACVLFDDGRVACAHVQSTQAPPPLAGISEAVEIACGAHSACARDVRGSVTCVDAEGELWSPDPQLGGARTLAPDCAVTEAGSLVCWNWTKKPKPQNFGLLAALLELDDGYLLDIQRAGLYQGDPSDGCVLRRNGDLWCWGRVTSEGERMPTLLANLGRAEDIRELRADRWQICWRGLGPWQCTNGENQPQNPFECDHQLCTCQFSNGTCISDANSSASADEDMRVADVVLHDGRCVVDALGRVWCQAWPELPPHELRLSYEGESARLEPFEGEAPVPELSPLPDPAASDCPAAVAASNRACKLLSSPGQPLACEPGKRRCVRECQLDSISAEVCEPDGFELISAHGTTIPATFLIYADGSKVWLGPQLRLEVAEARVDGGLSELEQLLDEDEQTPWYDSTHYIDAVTLCGLVAGRPACSAPLVRELTYSYVDWDEDGVEVNSESLRYRAELTITSAGVEVVVREGRHDMLVEPYNAGARLLRGGSHGLATLLDQPFVALDE